MIFSVSIFSSQALKMFAISVTESPETVKFTIATFPIFRAQMMTRYINDVGVKKNIFLYCFATYFIFK